MTVRIATEDGDPQSVDAVFDEFVDGVVGAVPNVLSGIIFLLIAFLVIKIVLLVVGSVFDRIYPNEQELIVELSVAIVGLFLWFGAALAFLKIVGMGDVAVSLGTAAGFIGLGVAFALKEMIADTVAGVYLLRDQDFQYGDVVETAAVTGTVAGIDLRKTRIRTDDGDLIVLANLEVEKKWTKRGEASDPNSRDEATE